MRSAAAEMDCTETFRGYGPEQRATTSCATGSAAIMRGFGVSLSEGRNICLRRRKERPRQHPRYLFGDNSVLIPDPFTPVYVDTNVMDGRRIIYADADESNGFLPMPTARRRISSISVRPITPTGAAYSREQAQTWVDFALENGSGDTL